MPPFHRAEVWTDFQCRGGGRSGFVPDLSSLFTTRAITAEESVQIAVSATSGALFADRRVLRLVRRDSAGVESFDEWRIRRRKDLDGAGAEAGQVNCTAYSPFYELAFAEIVQVLSTGETVHVFDLVNRTPTDIIDSFVLPAFTAIGVFMWARGTVDPTAPQNMHLDWMTPLALLQALATATNCELRVRRNGTTNYFIDLVNQIGAGASLPRLRLQKNVMAMGREIQGDNYLNRAHPRGGQLPGLSEYHTLARIILKVTGVSGSTLTVADPAGAIQPIAFDDQFNNGWFVMRERTGATFAITDTIKSTQQLVCSSVGGIATGERIQLRSADPQNLAVPVPKIAPTVGTAWSLPYYVGGGLQRLADASDGTTDWVTFNDQHTELFGVWCSQRLSDASATVDGPNGRFNFSVSISGVVGVGDFVYYMIVAGSSATPPHGVAFLSILWRVTSVDTVNNRASVVPHYAHQAGAILPNDGTKRVVVVRATGAARLTAGSIASSNDIFLTGISGATAAGDIVLLEQHCGGVLPDYVDQPAAATPAGYPVALPRSIDLPSLRGEGNVVPNSRFGTWSNPVNPPDGWSIGSGGGGTSTSHAQNTSAAFIKYGDGHSWRVNLLHVAAAIETKAVTPTFYLNTAGTSGLGRAALKISLVLAGFRNDARLLIRLWTADGVCVQEMLTLYSADTTFSNIPAEKIYSEGQWLDLTIPGIDFTVVAGIETRNRGGFFVTLDGLANGGAQSIVQVYLDAVAMYQVAYDPGSGVYIEGSYANQLLSAANNELLDHGQPEAEYTVDLVDLERIPGAPYAPDVLTLGGTADLTDPKLGITAQPRLIQMVVNELDPADTKLTLSTRRKPLTTVLGQGG